MAANWHGIVRWGARLAVAVAAVWPAAPTAVAQLGQKPKDVPAPKVTLQILDALARQYQEAGLPLPPPGAVPTWLPSGSWESVPGGKTHPTCLIGFETAPATEEGASGTFLVGTQDFEPSSVSSEFHLPRRLKPGQGLPNDCAPQDDGQQPSATGYTVNRWLVIAVQCHLRGYDRLAEDILARGLARDLPAEQRLAPTADGNLGESLAATAWNHWMNILLTADADRPAILARLEKLRAGFPVLDGPFQRDYLSALRQTLAPGKGAPGSVEAKIDALVDYDQHSGPSSTDGGNAQYEELLMLGFSAVPNYIAHLDDRRLTRSLTFRNDGRSPLPRLVGDVVSDLIEDLAGTEEFPNYSWQRPPGQPADKEHVARWWAKAGAMGEEAYMTKGVFPPTVVSAQLLAAKFPGRMEEVYLRLLNEKPESDCWVLEPAISGMAPDVARRLLRLGAVCANLPRALDAIMRLGEIDRPGADALLIGKLDHWPTDVSTRYAERPVEASAGTYVLTTGSVDVWQAFERALFRAVPALRMEMLGRLTEEGLGGPQDVRTLALLDLFLDDPEVRVIRKEDQASGGKFEGYPVTPGSRRLSVGDYTAGLLARLLGFKPPSDVFHNERWWTKYRETARAAIDQRARANLQTEIE